VYVELSDIIIQHTLKGCLALFVFTYESNRMDKWKYNEDLSLQGILQQMIILQ